jgi:hypothetical protein
VFDEETCARSSGSEGKKMFILFSRTKHWKLMRLYRRQFKSLKKGAMELLNLKAFKTCSQMNAMPIFNQCLGVETKLETLTRSGKVESDRVEWRVIGKMEWIMTSRVELWRWRLRLEIYF